MDGSREAIGPAGTRCDMLDATAVVFVVVSERRAQDR